jgi:dihydroorotate dehydrogenase
MIAYDIHESYDWNYVHAPADSVVADPPHPCRGQWDFCGIPVNSPLGIPAGPLLNGRWIRYYAALGFDVLTYKTVRSRYRACYDLPNLLHVEAAPLAGEGSTLRTAAVSDSWAISFGMPSKDPAVWQADVEQTRGSLASGQVLVVSVVASPQAEWTILDVARDFARCARWAADSGAQAVEANLSCPNVCSQEADLYLSPRASEEVASLLRATVPELPLVLKIGLFPNPELAEAVIEAVSPHVDALSSTNSITARVEGEFGGLRRGVGGGCITKRCLEELEMLARIVRRTGSPLRLIGVGGVMNAKDVLDRLAAGAHHVQLATAPMLDPAVGLEIRAQLA